MERSLRRKLRRAAAVLVQLTLVAVANHAAFALRFDGQVPAWAYALELQMLPWLLAMRGAAFVPFGVYQGLWRYAGIWDLRNIVAAVLASSAAFFAVVAFVGGVPAYPRSVLIIDALIVTFLIGGVRLAVRLSRGAALMRSGRPPGRRVLIFGAGEAGASIARDIKSQSLDAYTPVGFIDDNAAKVGESIHGVPVLGTRHDLRRIMAQDTPDEVLIAMPAAEPATVRSVVRALEPYKVRMTILPNIRDILAGTVTVSQIRRLAIEDLLPRAPIGIDEAPLRHVLAGRRVMVTGAAGSIGSELCQQVLALRPESLVLYDRSENGLYAVNNLLADRAATTAVLPMIGDITDVDRLEHTMAQYRPEIVFHAAAHKHVPLMESHPCEAVKNNVGGTRIVIEASRRHGVSRFILISTDKAVNPTSIMGVTKRVAELLTMSRSDDTATSCLAVRFGNVLGSNGSAIPRFIEQIKSGGPVTITHPAICRYFMLLPEAAQLVLHVAGRGRNGGVYVLNMGDQIRVVEMARNLIRLSGYVPDEDIKLSYIGLRPGEKLFEELVRKAETVRASSIDQVFEVTSCDSPSPDWLAAQVRRLEHLAKLGHTSEVVRLLSLIVPEFTGRPWAQEPVETDVPIDVRLPLPHLGSLSPLQT